MRCSGVLIAVHSPCRTLPENGGATAEFHTPEEYPGNLQFKDGLLHIRRART